MSESHELYKKYLADKEKTLNAIKRGSKYVDDYVKDEQISRSNFREKEREEKNDQDRMDKLFGNIF